ncbi:3-phosphoshikimate 1-carboxyvinyltransferase [Arenimonas sp.]|uniref:3-phosphoshikimate 1-carboxyvinyltransferase n=1 Tax=Arenimonas sp. TaxID=1872635 RepID=UPI0039E2E70A
MSLDWLAGPAGALRGEIRVPGDKSISHRAIMLGAIAEGSSHIHGFLEGEDTRATARIFAQLGVRIEQPSEHERIVHGVGLHGLQGSDEALDCGNAGTAMRLLTGLLAGQAFESVLVGDESLSRRPMRRVIEPLERMGARIEASGDGTAPIRINIKNNLQGIDYKIPVASAQVKSALLLAGLYAQGETHVHEPHPTRDYTERMLAAFGSPIAFRPGEAAMLGGFALKGTDVDVPSDFSSAAFFLVAASLVPGSDLLIRKVGMNPRRTGLLEALRLMGADITEEARTEQGGEPVADLRVRYAPLQGIHVPERLVPDMIDEFPALFAAASLAKGETLVTGAAELRVKESDRIAVMSRGLRALGAQIDERPDGALIRGGRLRGGETESAGDHRIAMALAVAAQVADAEVRIGDCANVATSFPGFAELARDCGFGLRLA